MKNYWLYNLNCYDFIKTMKSNSIDLILTDPPYNISKYSTGNIHFNYRKEINNNIATWDKVPLKIEFLSHEFKRILKPTGNLFIFTSYNQIGQWHEILDPLFTSFQFMVWHKTNPPPKIFRAGFLNSCELIICAWNKGHTWNFSTQNEMHNFIESPICSAPERLKDPFHPTQKPIAILKKIISIASNPNDLVFDPFMGVGSTCVASLELQRRFVGCEIDKSYFGASQKRIIPYI